MKNSCVALLVPLTISRVMPYYGITFLRTSVAHKHTSDLALISYVLAIFSVVAVMLSMSLGATGNLIAEHSDDIQEKPYPAQARCRQQTSKGLKSGQW